MNIVTTIASFRAIRPTLPADVGFIPTMGHLHEGHMAILRQAKAENDIVVASIFVNRTQFGDENDYARYPHTLEEDSEKCQSVGVDYLFLPSHEELYPDHYEVKVHEMAISESLEGRFRPGHFDGMLTIVLKLLNIIKPARAYFGEKDYQQLLLVKKMVDSLFVPVEIIACQTVRSTDGLALSSRNSRLNRDACRQAAWFPTLLRAALSTEEVRLKLQACGFQVDYIEDKWGRRLGAVWLDDVRLIDNVVI